MKLRLALLLLASSALVLQFPPAASGAQPRPWQEPARELSAVPDETRAKRLEELRAIPDLESQLRWGLGGPEKFLALDVIAALKLSGLTADLIRVSASDPTGYFYHALNALVTDANRGEITALYRERVSNSSTTPAAKIALLDTLSRMGAPLGRPEMVQLLADPSYEVQAAAIEYVRSFLIRRDHTEYIPLLARTVREGPFQLRIQVLMLARELSRDFTAPVGPAWDGVLKICEHLDRKNLRPDELELCTGCQASGRFGSCR